MSEAVIDTLYFGTDTPDGVVSDAEWDAFLVSTVRPEFDGFTTWDTKGQWKGDDEGGHVLRFIHRPSDDYTARIKKISDEYRRRFRQEAVLHTRDFACMEF
jgi:hypothetical protein